MTTPQYASSGGPADGKSGDGQQQPAPVRTGNYVLDGRGIAWMKSDTARVQLTNFQAFINGDVKVDDGAEVRRVYEITARLNGRSARFTVPADRFRSMTWADEHMGAEAIIWPGMGLRDHVPVAIKELSAAREGGVPARHVYAHTGWRKLPGGWGYLTASGAITADGLDPDVTVELTGSLGRYELPDPEDPAAVRDAVLRSLDILDLADDSVTVPLLGAVYRAPLPLPPDCTPWLRGQTGTLKTALCALAQQHFGAGMDAKHLPGSWESTANKLEVDAHALAGVVFTVDDYRPDLSAFEARKRAMVADRLIRGAANQSSRGRLRSDISRRPDRPPRAQPLCSAEDLPPGPASLKARTLISQVPAAPAEGAVDLVKLTAVQESAGNGMLALAMAGYVRRLAVRYELTRDNLGPRLAELRAAARKGGHLRTPENVASLYTGWEQFLIYAEQAGAIGAGEHGQLRNRAWNALRELGAAQARYLAEGDHVAAFLRALNAIIASGRGHLLAAGASADPPAPGRLLGWVAGDDVYLHPDVCYAEARQWAEREGTPLGVTRYQLFDDMKERGLLASTEKDRTTARPVIGGKQVRVLHLTKYQFESCGE
jgi:hypothetical protein